MTIQYTPIYQIPYPQASDPIKTTQVTLENQAKRIEQVFTDASLPAGNPDVASITARLVALEKRGKIDAFTCTGTKANFDTGNQTIATLARVSGESNATLATPGASKITISEAGVYSIDFQIAMFNDAGLTSVRAATGRTFIDINAGTTTISRTAIPVSEDQTTGNVSGKLFAAGAVVNFGILQTTGGTAYYRATVRLVRLY